MPEQLPEKDAPVVLTRPDSPKRTMDAREQKKAIREEAYITREAELQRVRQFLELDKHDLEMIDATLLIQSRTYCGTNGPIEKFISDLLQQYLWADDRGKGLTVEDIEDRLDELRGDMKHSLGEAFFIADRYERPEEVQVPEVSNVE